MSNKCTNCQSVIKSGFMTNVTASSDDFNSIINQVLDKDISYCSNCSNNVYVDAQNILNEDSQELLNEFNEKIKNIPVLSLQNPLNWDYVPIKLVTGQSVTGTGVFSEISSSISDLLGGQSENLNNKIRVGEGLCLDQIRLSTFNLGGHAVIGVDIDYSELGGGKGMIMVCVTGTAIKLKNPQVLESDLSNNIEELQRLKIKLKDIKLLTTELKKFSGY